MRRRKTPEDLWRAVLRSSEAAASTLPLLCPPTIEVHKERVRRGALLPRTVWVRGLQFLVAGEVDEVGVSRGGRVAFVRKVPTGFLPPRPRGGDYRAVTECLLVRLEVFDSTTYNEARTQLENAAADALLQELRQEVRDMRADPLSERLRRSVMFFAPYAFGRVTRLAWEVGCSREHASKTLSLEGLGRTPTQHRAGDPQNSTLTQPQGAANNVLVSETDHRRDEGQAGA